MNQRSIFIVNTFKLSTVYFTIIRVIVNVLIEKIKNFYLKLAEKLPCLFQCNPQDN